MRSAPLVYIFRPEESRHWLILDRDGTLNLDEGYTHSLRDLEILPGVVDTLSALSSGGWGLLIATNQAGIAHGIFTLEDMTRFNSALVERLDEHGVPIAGIAVCPHHPAGRVAAWARECDCRKPAPGLIHQLRETFCHTEDIVAFAGNAPSDEMTAYAARVPFFWARDTNDWRTLRNKLEGLSQ